MRTIKRWAVLGKGGLLACNADGYDCVFQLQMDAAEQMQPGERIVRVEIREVPTAKKGAKR